MKKARVYIDTSVIGGCFDEEFASWSNGLLKDFRLGHFKPVVSEVVAFELESAPERVKSKYEELIIDGAEILKINDETLKLLNVYRQQKILGQKFERDMMHIALATVHEVDILVSWNFKHIVHFDKIQLFNKANEKAGYQPLTIYSPREVTNYEEGF